METTAALIISTYNWPQALDLCLQSVLNQSLLPREIIIADDGSTSETRVIVEKYKKLLPVPVKHVWHEDRGFRLAEIRNRAIVKSESEYLIFIDGDTILDRDFVSDHVFFSRTDRFITGSRILVGETLTSALLKGVPIRFRFFSNSFSNKLNAIRNRRIASLYMKPGRNIYDVRGCNLSMWRKDLLHVDGFDQQYTGWGREDSDLVARLLNSGKKRSKLKFAAVQYHLYHQPLSRESVERNDAILRETLVQNRVKALKGISCL